MTRFTIVIEAQHHAVPAAIRLRQALKLLLRAFAFRCVSVQEVGAGDEQVRDGAGKHEEVAK